MEPLHTIRNRTQNELASFLGQYRWDHFLTLTHRFAGSEPRQLKQVHAMVRKLERIAQTRVSYVSFSERTINGHLHHHVLLHGTAHLQIKAIQKRWPSGISKVEAFDRSKGGARYASKAYGTRADPEFQLTRTLPPRWDEPVADAPKLQPREGHLRARAYRARRYGSVQRQPAKAAVVQRLPTRRRPEV